MQEKKCNLESKPEQLTTMSNYKRLSGTSLLVYINMTQQK